MKPASNDGLTFPDATYIYGSEKETYFVNKIIELRKNDRNRFFHVKDHLFCPLCELAPLKFIGASQNGNRRAHFAAIDSSKHEKNCIYNYPRATKAILSQIDENPDSASIQTRLNGLLSLLDSDAPPKEHPCIVNVDTKGQILSKQAKNTDGVLTYHIPQRKLSYPLDKSCIDVPQCFYGKASLEWHTKGPNETRNYPLHELYIYRIAEDDPTCILRFNGKVFGHLPEPIRKDDGTKFVDALAFYVQLSDRYTPAGIKRKDGKPVYTAFINHSSKIIFWSTSSNQ